MYGKSLLIIALLSFVAANYDDDLHRIDTIYDESTCTRSGGTCVVKEDCRAGYEADEGLCPQQQRNGIECCYGISIKETRCRRRGGECMTQNCNKNLIFKEATDCGNDEHCCILI